MSMSSLKDVTPGKYILSERLEVLKWRNTEEFCDCLKSDYLLPILWYLLSQPLFLTPITSNFLNTAMLLSF